jgi:tripartite-type tricarboxylate transporter receptor subunit TctC
VKALAFSGTAIQSAPALVFIRSGLRRKHWCNHGVDRDGPTYFPFVLAVKADSRFHTLADLIAEARAKPDTLTFSSVGVGSTQHLVGELLSSMAGIKMIHVPYKGGGAPINDLLGGQIDLLSDTLTITAPQLAAGTIRGLGVTSRESWPSIANVPPIAATVPGYEVKSWLGIAAPKNVPQPIVGQLNREVRGSSPDEMRSMIASKITRWKQVIKDANIPQQ